jgi:hypothetical protein
MRRLAQSNRVKLATPVVLILRSSRLEGRGRWEPLTASAEAARTIPSSFETPAFGGFLTMREWFTPSPWLLA